MRHTSVAAIAVLAASLSRAEWLLLLYGLAAAFAVSGLIKVIMIPVP